MDPDIVRQQEEAEREANEAAAKKTLAAASLKPLAAMSIEAPAVLAASEALAEVSVAAPEPVAAPYALTAVSIEAPSASADIASEKPAKPKKKKPHPERRALPPIRSSRSPSREPSPTHGGFLRGVARFLGYAIAGAMLGVIIGNAAVGYLSLSPDRSASVIFSVIGCFTFICALVSILQEH
jgi:hypothetical protein